MSEQSFWWQETTIYQIYPRSFADSNSDGIGDLPGIISRLDYIQDLGFETIWLSPHFVSPQRDFGYDVADYYNTAPEYGTMDDALQLIEEVHRREMKIIFDLVLNHTSDQHPWFIESRSSRDNPRRDWYIWRDGRGRRPPNNWAAIPGGSGWSFDNQTDQWYFHNFLPFQPDLNYRNPEVKAAMFDVMRFWLDHGVDGFRLDIFHAIYKDDQFRDNPVSWRFVPTPEMDEGYFQKLTYTLNRPETFALAREVRALIDRYDPPRFVIGEVFGRDVVHKYLGEDDDGLNLVLLFDLMHLNGVTAAGIKTILRTYETTYPPPCLPTYSLGNHDRRRFFSRIGKDAAAARLLTFLLYTARGIPITYYGDEIGIPDGDFPHQGAKDSVARAYWWLPAQVARLFNLYINRDGCRTPMQWDDTAGVGFTSAGVDPWLPVHPDYPDCNVARQRERQNSLLNTHRQLLRLRRERPSLRRGTLTLLPDSTLPAGVVGYDREADGERLRILLNAASAPLTITNPPGPLLLRSDAGCIIVGRSLTLSPGGAVILDIRSGENKIC